MPRMQPLYAPRRVGVCMISYPLCIPAISVTFREQKYPQHSLFHIVISRIGGINGTHEWSVKKKIPLDNRDLLAKIVETSFSLPF